MYPLWNQATLWVRRIFLKPSLSKSSTYSAGDPGTEQVTAGGLGTRRNNVQSQVWTVRGILKTLVLLGQTPNKTATRSTTK